MPDRTSATSASRLLAGAIALGVCAGLGVGAVEVGWLAYAARVYFDGTGELARYGIRELGFLAGVGAIAGFAQGLIAVAIADLARALEARRPSGRWSDRLYTFLCAPLLAWGCAQIFKGPRARAIPGHTLYAIAIGLFALGAIYAGLGLWGALGRKIAARPIGRLPLLVLVALALATWSLYVGDQRILPRLYRFFHVGLDLATFAAAELTLLLLWRIAASWRGLRVRPARAFVLGLLALVVGAAALSSFDRSRGLRALALERSAPL
ncbi:MAG TPA: hypothetical protein VII38_14335, partial [Polyangia bacterium]